MLLEVEFSHVCEMYSLFERILLEVAVHVDGERVERFVSSLQIGIAELFGQLNVAVVALVRWHELTRSKRCDRLRALANELFSGRRRIVEADRR